MKQIHKLCLFLIFFSVNAFSQPKIYDCFTFFNELELLDVRLHELDPVVDYFVIVESSETFQGKPKPMYFAENAHLFKQFADKIIYVPVREHLKTKDQWKREHYQRNQIMRGLKGCKREDIILISDLDEIIQASCLTNMITPLLQGKANMIGVWLHTYQYYLNRFYRMGDGTVATTYKYLSRKSPQFIRDSRNKCPAVGTGWHFSWMGGRDRFITKLEAFSHVEYDTPEHRENYMSLFPGGTIVEIDQSYPQYILDNLEFYKKIGFVYE